MKKLAVLVAVALLTVGTCFADTFAGGEKLVENFFNNGNYIKIVIDNNNVNYIYKHSSVLSLYLDEDDFRYMLVNGAGGIYEISKYDIVNDANGNIIISKKSKKK